jgi:hypothetical protein
VRVCRVVSFHTDTAGTPGRSAHGKAIGSRAAQDYYFLSVPPGTMASSVEVATAW